MALLPEQQRYSGFQFFECEDEKIICVPDMEEKDASCVRCIELWPDCVLKSCSYIRGQSRPRHIGIVHANLEETRIPKASNLWIALCVLEEHKLNDIELGVFYWQLKMHDTAPIEWEGLP